MKETRYFYVPDAAHQQELPSDEAMHAMRVLRLKGGDELFLMGCDELLEGNHLMEHRFPCFAALFNG